VIKTEPIAADLRSPRAVARAWWPVAGVATLLFAAATVTRTDADLWGHIRFGLDTLHARGLTAVDPYSFTQDRPWINHEWLSEVQMGLAYAMGGTAGLALLKAVLAFTVFALVWSSSRGASLAARLTIIVLLVFGTLHMTATLRPQLWTFVSMAILCRALIDVRSRIRPWLPLLFALWGNLHGGWIVGLGVLGVWAAAESWSTPGAVRQWRVLVPACAIGTLCTPYGWKLWAFMAETVRMNRAIQEWQPLWGTPVLNWVPWCAAVAATLWVAVRRGRGWLPIVGTLAMLAYASARVSRMESLFIASAAILLAPRVIARFPSKLIGMPARLSGPEWIAALVILIVPVGAAAWITSRSLSCLPVPPDYGLDVQPVQLLSDAESGRVVTYFNWGEYAIWHLGPRLRVSMDGRRETVYSDKRIAEHDAIVAGRPAGLDALAAWQSEYVWLPATSVTTKTWLSQHGYRIDFDGPHSFLAVRNDLPQLRRSAPKAQAAICFPG
jgi:hypothetical protein